MFAYSSNTVCDKHNYILGFEVTPGNVHDSVSFEDLYTRMKEERSKVKGIVVNSGYKIPAIAKQIIDYEKIPVMPYKRPMTKKGFFKKYVYVYVYDEYYNCYLCPNNQVLKYSTTNKDGYREYKSDKSNCKDCSYLKQCTESKDHVKVICRHVWEEN